MIVFELRPLVFVRLLRPIDAALVHGKPMTTCRVAILSGHSAFSWYVGKKQSEKKFTFLYDFIATIFLSHY